MLLEMLVYFTNQQSLALQAPSRKLPKLLESTTPHAQTIGKDLELLGM